jgi:type IV pilus assembly protein PilC
MLGEAFARYGILDPASRKLVLVAEQQGKLPGTFRQLAQIYGNRHDRKKRFFYAMVEPAIIIVLGMIFARNLFMSELITNSLYVDTESAIRQFVTKSLIETGLFACVCAIIVLVSMNLPVEMGLRSLMQRITLRIPVIGESGSLYAVATFCRYVKQSLASGLTAYRALELAAEASNSPRVVSRIAKAQEHIADGGTIAQALFIIKAFPDEVIEAIDIGEESGHLEERLDQLAQRYDQLSLEAFERFIYATIYFMRIVIVVVVLAAIFMVILNLDLGL